MGRRGIPPRARTWMAVMKSALVVVVCLLLLMPASRLYAASQQPIGSALVVVNLVTAAFNRDTRTLQRGDRVHQDELIEVGLDGASELKLDDDTKLALGAGARLMLDKFVYDPAKTKGSIVLDLIKGSFRFITGVAEKPTYVIKTPAAAITVRGTIFDVYVEDNGESWLLLLEGAIQVCNARGQCRELTEPGKLIRITEDGDVGPPSRWASLSDDGKPFDDAFPFVTKTPSIDPEPTLTRDVIILGALPKADPPKADPPKKRRTETTKPKKKQAERTPTKTREKTKPKKKTRTAKRRSSGDENIMTGMDIVIGVGGGIGRGIGGGRHRGGGGYPSGGGRTVGGR